MALFIARSALHWLRLSKGGLGWLGPFKSLRHQSSIWLLFHPAGFHHTGMPAMHSRGTSHTLLLFVGRYKACRHHEQMLAPAVRLQWPSARFSRGSSCLLKMLVDNEALGQSDCRWTLEWLNKSRRWVSLLWVSPVSHLFIAPLSLISSHCCATGINPSVVSCQNDALFICLCACVPWNRDTCPPLVALGLKCHLKCQKRVVSASTFKGKCALVTLLHVSQLVLVRE